MLQRGVGQLHETVPVLGDGRVGIRDGEHEGDAAGAEPHLRAEKVHEDLVAGCGGRPEDRKRGKLVTGQRPLEGLDP